MKMKKINFVKLLVGYKKGWVAISNDFNSVVAYGKTLKEVMKKVNKDKQKVYFFPSGENYSNYTGFINFNADNTI